MTYKQKFRTDGLSTVQYHKEGCLQGCCRDSCYQLINRFAIYWILMFIADYWSLTGREDEGVISPRGYTIWSWLLCSSVIMFHDTGQTKTQILSRANLYQIPLFGRCSEVHAYPIAKLSKVIDLSLFRIGCLSLGFLPLWRAWCRAHKWFFSRDNTSSLFHFL